MAGGVATSGEFVDLAFFFGIFGRGCKAASARSLLLPPFGLAHAYVYRI